MTNSKFFRAIRTHDFDTISCFLEQPNPIQYTHSLDENNQTPLNVALSNGANRGVVDALLRGGVYVSVDNIVYAAGLPNREVLPWLCNSARGIINRPHNDGWNPLQLALLCNLDEGTVLALLNNGANPRLTDPYGWTPLLRAIRYNPKAHKIIPALLERGADPNASGCDNLSLLHMAIIYNPNSFIIFSLLKYGADPDSLNPDGQTVLHAGKFLGGLIIRHRWKLVSFVPSVVT